MGDIIESAQHALALWGLLTMICWVIVVLCDHPE